MGMVVPYTLLPSYPGTLARRHRDGFCTVCRVHGTFTLSPAMASPRARRRGCQSPLAARALPVKEGCSGGERGTVEDAGDLSVRGNPQRRDFWICGALVVRTTRSGCPCWHHDDLGRLSALRSVLSSPVPSPVGLRGDRSHHAAYSPCLGADWLTGSLAVLRLGRAGPKSRWALRERLAASEGPVVQCLAGLRAMPRPAGSRKLRLHSVVQSRGRTAW
ncbi:hypothetical protein QBC39DRAFT_119328 [Podospora conica]|nr:hypothetical protein QBC39DRAFT_119328 [Schizothecium conicum]